MVELLACVLVCLEGWRSNCKRRRFIVGISRAGDDGSLHGYQEIDAFVEINLTTFSNQPRGIRRLLFPHTFLLTTHNLAISRVEILPMVGSPTTPLLLIQPNDCCWCHNPSVSSRYYSHKAEYKIISTLVPEQLVLERPIHPSS